MSRRPPSNDMIVVIHQLEMEPADLSKAQWADKVLASVIKTHEEGKPVPQSVPPGLHNTFIQNGLLC